MGLFGLMLGGGLLLWNRPILLERFLVTDKSLESADALVLMAGARYQRLPAVVTLYEQGVAPRILLTNDGTLGPWSDAHQRNLYQVEWAREYLLERGIPAEAIELLEFIESGSYYDALNTRIHLERTAPARSLLVISSNYHTRRTLWTFEEVFAGTGVEIGVYPIPRPSTDQRRWLLRNGVELIKLGYYRIRYGFVEDPSDTLAGS